jgi:hypothetical protein
MRIISRYQISKSRNLRLTNVGNSQRMPAHIGTDEIIRIYQVKLADPSLR